MNVNLMKLLDFDGLFVSFFNKMSTYVNAIGGIAAAILGSIGIFYLVAKAWPLLVQNEPLNIYPLFRPIIIFVICTNFQGIVITPMHYALSPLRTYTRRLAEKSESNNKARVDAIIDKAQDQRKAAIKDDPDSWGITKAISLGIENLKEWLMTTILSICSFFKSAVYIIMNFIRIFCMVLLAMFGPFAFVLSIIPGFENGLGNWFSKYISIYLWAPIFSIISILLDNAELFLAERIIGVAGSTGIWGLMVLLIVVYIIGAYTFISTPTFASWIVQGGAEIGQLTRGVAIAGALAAGAAGWGAGKGAKVAQGASVASGGVVGGVVGAADAGIKGGGWHGMASGAVSGAKTGAKVAERGINIASNLLRGKFNAKRNP
jgi:hypothetical protein